MNNEGLEEKIEKVNQKMKDMMDTAAIKALYAKDKIDEAVENSKSNINALKESYLIFSKEASGKLSSLLIQSQMNLEVAKEELEKEKEIYDKKKFEKYIKSKEKYIEACINLSNLALEEAKLALLEVKKSKSEYEEEYDKNS